MEALAGLPKTTHFEREGFSSPSDEIVLTLSAFGAHTYDTRADNNVAEKNRTEVNMHVLICIGATARFVESVWKRE